jgi:hypothetical protein
VWSRPWWCRSAWTTTLQTRSRAASATFVAHSIHRPCFDETLLLSISALSQLSNQPLLSKKLNFFCSDI